MALREFPGPKENLLLVEGIDDLHALGHLFSAYALTERTRGKHFQIKMADGIEPLIDSLTEYLDSSDLQRFGIVIDADHPPLNRWESLRSGFKGRVELPDSPDSNGTIVTSGSIRVGIWVMPDNVQRGALEDFIRLLVPEEDKLWEYAEQTVKDISSEDRPKPEDGLNAENWDAKAKIHTWLAWREKPGQPIGEAINQRYLDPKAQEAQRFIAWVKLLFEIEEQV